MSRAGSRSREAARPNGGAGATSTRPMRSTIPAPSSGKGGGQVIELLVHGGVSVALDHAFAVFEVQAVRRSVAVDDAEEARGIVMRHVGGGGPWRGGGGGGGGRGQ